MFKFVFQGWIYKLGVFKMVCTKGVVIVQVLRSVII